MKKLLENNDAIITYRFVPTKSHKELREEGVNLEDIIPHCGKIIDVYYYHDIYSKNGDIKKSIKISLSMDFLRELFKESVKIEKTIKNFPYDALPF